MADMPDEDQLFLFTAPADWEFPELATAVVPAGARVDVAAEDDAWSEFDTAAADLEHYGATLIRHRSRGWSVLLDGEKVSADVPRAADGQDRAGAPGRAVPVDLRDLLTGVRAGRPLRRVRDVSTRQVTRVVLDADNAVLGEIDDVWTRTNGAQSRRVRLIAVDEGFGAAARRQLTRAGAKAAPATPPPRPKTVGDAVRSFVQAQRREILHGDVELRRGADAIHPTRVAARRLRSVVRIVAVFDPAAATTLDGELSWYCAVLGQVRDTDVLRAHFATTLAELAQGDWTPATSAAIEAAVDAAAVQARSALRAEMSGRRYLALLGSLRSWADDPPLTPAGGKGVKRLTGYARSAERTLTKRLAAAHDPESTHRARKSAKRARYVAEFVTDTLGGAGDVIGDAGKQAKKLQAALGDRQDAAMAADFLAGLLDGDVPLSAAAAFGCGIAWAAETERAAG